ncbi:hypothetical protein FHR75_004184 [Kineococcus radiotolerans]|uniref:Uncharacterized protein n=1 Tax=Kineococcus radiotolerans TaxID=131568 RepID=A0A7W4TRG0_KINRA|nr:hypothetical protein [Kineococcus radiotolerans]MBB2903342.1 hypothetical protein [Kineococcus radiotolerans]
MDHEDSTTVKSLKLPAGWRLQWRSDDHWRQVHARQHRVEMAGRLDPAEASDWTPWSGAEPLEGRGGGRWDGTPTWWSLVGELLDGAGVEVVLADGHRPPVLQVGRAWACTWVSPPQPATVHRGASELTFPFYKPDYLPD